MSRMIESKKEATTRREIEEKLGSVGDYVKMDYLQRCLKMQLDFDTRKYVLTTLSVIYESRKMYLEAGKLMRAAAEINATFEAKMNDFIKSMELYIRAGNYEEADISFSKAIACASDPQKLRIKDKRKLMYKEAAKDYMIKDKRKHAMEAYEKLMEMELQPEEKQEVKQNLMKLYEKLGKIKEYYSLKN